MFLFWTLIVYYSLGLSYFGYIKIQYKNEHYYSVLDNDIESEQLLESTI